MNKYDILYARRLQMHFQGALAHLEYCENSQYLPDEKREQTNKAIENFKKINDDLEKRIAEMENTFVKESN